MIQELRNFEPHVLEWSSEEVARLRELGLLDVVHDAGTRKWSGKEYQQLVEAGLLEGKHVELLQGEIIVMHPMGSRHYNAVRRCDKLLSAWSSAGYTVRMQATLDLGDDQPEPDIAVVLGCDDDYADHHPTSAILVVEVADSSLGTDRRIKTSLYASAGIPEFWIVNLVARQVEVYRLPIIDAAQLYGYRYADVQVLAAHEQFSPLALPGEQIQVRQLLPA